jgi:protein disulfide-isomerase A6
LHLLCAMQLYDEGRGEEDFVDYLNEKCGTYRAVGGGLNGKVGLESFSVSRHALMIWIVQAGRVAKLDALAQEFFSAVPESRKSIYESAVGAAGLSREYGKHYIRVMEKVLNGTADYVEKETAR